MSNMLIHIFFPFKTWLSVFSLVGCRSSLYSLFLVNPLWNTFTSSLSDVWFANVFSQVLACSCQRWSWRSLARDDLCAPSSYLACRNQFKQQITNGSKSRQGFICKKEKLWDRTWAGNSAGRNQTKCLDIWKFRGFVALGRNAARQGASHLLPRVSKKCILKL